MSARHLRLVAPEGVDELLLKAAPAAAVELVAADGPTRLAAFLEQPVKQQVLAWRALRAEVEAERRAA